MLFRLCNANDGILKLDYRRQLLATLSVIIIVLCHGIGLGWLSPMLLQLQSEELTPLNFKLSVHDASWIGALICAGGLIGNVLFAFLLDRLGRKWTICCLAIPHTLLWILVYFAQSIEYLYVARICAGMTGGGTFVVIPIYIGEIADRTIRGRLSSLIGLSLNVGILAGFIISSHVPYHCIPLTVVPLPIVYALLAARLPETPQHCLRKNREQQAESSLKFYRNYRGTTKAEIEEFTDYFEDLKSAVAQQRTQSGKTEMRDFLNKPTMKKFCTGFVLCLVNIYCGSFALINYMSSVFVAAKTQMDPNTSTIIIGVVQIAGTYTATIVIDRFGRKILLIVSTAGMGIGLAILGLYGFFAEEMDVDLRAYSSWLPLSLIAFIIFIGNCGIISATIIVLVELMPPTVRSVSTSIYMALLSIFGFILLKIFPIFLHNFGLSATMWFCASFCAFGVFYVTIFFKETNGKSIDKTDADDDS